MDKRKAGWNRKVLILRARNEQIDRLVVVLTMNCPKFKTNVWDKLEPFLASFVTSNYDIFGSGVLDLTLSNG
jgi:hypothetical protein